MMLPIIVYIIFFKIAFYFFSNKLGWKGCHLIINFVIINLYKLPKQRSYRFGSRQIRSLIIIIEILLVQSCSIYSRGRKWSIDMTRVIFA